jgi:hypothetical protein
MASSQKIEYNACIDIKTLLTNGGVSNVIQEYEEQPNAPTSVIVRCINMNDNLADGKIPTGMKEVTLSVDCLSHEGDDNNGSALAILTGDVRTLIYDGDIISSLNSVTSYHTYYGLAAGDDIPETQERYRIRSIVFDLILKPETT